MPRMSPTERAERVTRFLFGLRHPRIAEALATRGFRDEDIEEGWRLLRAATRTHMPVPSPHGDEGAANRFLAAWCKEWVPMITLTLRRRHPQALANLESLLAAAGSTARTVVVMMWLTQLRDPASDLAKASPGALDVLEQRGLTPAVLAQVDGAYGVLSRDGNGKDHPTTDELTAADEELWAYYLEWSHAARMVLKDRRLLRRLGLLRSAGASGGDDGPGEPPTGP